MARVMFSVGETIFSQGDESTLTYQIVAGSVDIVILDRAGAEKRVASLGPDEVFGEMGIIDPAPRSATAIAREDVVCEVFTAEEVDELMVSDPARAMSLIRSLIVRLRGSNRKLATKAPLQPPRKPEGF